MAMRRKALEAACHKMRITQAELAEELEVSTDIVSRWIRAKVIPTRASQARLAEFFKGYDIEELLEIASDDEDDPPDEVMAYTTEPLQLDENSNTPIRTILWLPPAPTVHKFITSDIVRRFWQIAHTDYSPDEMTHAVATAIKELSMTMGDLITRRDVLCELASIPMMALGQKYALPDSHRYEEMLRYCTTALEGCWELYRDSDPVGAQHAYQCVCTYVPLLETIAHDEVRLRSQALDLAAQYAILKTMLGWKFLKRIESISHAQNALGLSKESANILLQLSARSKLAYTYITAKNYIKAMETMQEGEFEIKEYQCKKRGPSLPSGIIGNFYSGYSIAQVYNGIDPDMALGIATESMPINGHIAFVGFTASEQAMEAAWTYCTKGDSDQAMKWLRRIVDPETLVSCSDTQSEYERFETLNILTGTLLQSNERDMGHIIHIWTKTIEWATAHQKEVLYDGAMLNFARIQALWPREQAIKKLMPLTSHW